MCKELVKNLSTIVLKDEKTKDNFFKAIGWIYNNSDAVLARDTFVKDVKKSNLTTEEKTALIINSKKIVKEYKNQSDIINIALEHLNNNNNASIKNIPIDDDWISLFMDKARIVNSEELKMIWGKILAQEYNSPGVIPKALISTLEIMDKDDAKAFLVIRSMSIKYEDISNNDSLCIIISSSDYNDGYCEEKGISYNSFVSLKSLGLIEYDFDRNESAYTENLKEKTKTISYFEKTYTFNPPVNKFNCGNVIYTKTGLALAKAIEPEFIDGYFENHCLNIVITNMDNNPLENTINQEVLIK